MQTSWKLLSLRRLEVRMRKLAKKPIGMELATQLISICYTPGIRRAFAAYGSFGSMKISRD
jgi:hypothetical protein